MNKLNEALVMAVSQAVLKDFIIPKIKSVSQKWPEYISQQNFIEKSIEKYLSQRFEKISVIDTIALPNMQILLDELYEPLTISKKGNDAVSKQIKIDSYPSDFIPEYCRVLIEDTAGMGKSTISKKLFLSIIKQNSGIPILIELRQINEENDFFKEIQNQLSPLGTPIPDDFIHKMLSEGEFIFLLDGFDEISNDDKDFVIKDLHRFIEKVNDNFFMITSRLDDSLASFGDFQKFNINPLKAEEAHSLIRRYDKFSAKPLAKQLIEKLEHKREDSINEFLSNPFLVSLLYKSYEHKKDIPLKKCQFYQQVYEALFETHDLSKEGFTKRKKHCQLQLDEFDRVLRHLGYLTSIKNKVEYDRNEIINFIEKSKNYTTDLIFNASDFLKDLITTVPLFKKEGLGFRWAHKSLQDYFAAKFILIDSRDKQNDILSKIFNDSSNSRFYNILDIFYELDTSLFESTILSWLLDDYEKFAISLTDAFSKKIKPVEIETRISRQYNSITILYLANAYEAKKMTEDGEYVSSMFRKIKEKYAVECNHIIHKQIDQSQTLLIFEKSRNNLSTILRIMKNRYPQLFHETISYATINKSEISHLEEGIYYSFNTEPENILNLPENFNQSNKLFQDFNNHPKHREFIDKLRSIRKHISEKNDNELTDW